MQTIAIIIPCYNEAARLQPGLLAELIVQNEGAVIFFADDGSTDGTMDILRQFNDQYPDKTVVVALAKNSGKAAAVLAGINAALQQNKFDYLGYLDADLSTPPKQFNLLFSTITAEQKDFVFGSRLKTINRLISRKYYRHLFGRGIATIIDSRYKLGIYDTQCGAKIFTSAVSKEIFDRPFVTRWLFDVELFLRLREKGCIKNGIEVPLEEWKDVKGSKLKFIHFPLIGREIIRLFRKYPSPPQRL